MNLDNIPEGYRTCPEAYLEALANERAALDIKYGDVCATEPEPLPANVITFDREALLQRRRDRLARSL